MTTAVEDLNRALVVLCETGPGLQRVRNDSQKLAPVRAVPEKHRDWLESGNLQDESGADVRVADVLLGRTRLDAPRHLYKDGKLFATVKMERSEIEVLAPLHVTLRLESAENTRTEWERLLLYLPEIATLIVYHDLERSLVLQGARS